MAPRLIHSIGFPIQTLPHRFGGFFKKQSLTLFPANHNLSLEECLPQWPALGPLPCTGFLVWTFSVCCHFKTSSQVFSSPQTRKCPLSWHHVAMVSRQVYKASRRVSSRILPLIPPTPYSPPWLTLLDPPAPMGMSALHVVVLCQVRTTRHSPQNEKAVTIEPAMRPHSC